MYFVYHIPHPNNPEDLSQGYVGVTVNPKSRFVDHSKGDLIVGRAIRKYQISFESLKILHEFDTAEEAFAKEKELRPEIKIGWNIGVGGNGGSRGPQTVEAKLLMSAKMSGENNPYFGKKHDDKIKEKISKALLDKPEEWRKECASKAGKANVGKVRTAESKDKYKNVAASRPKFTCAHCGKTGQYNSMIAHHGENCKKKVI